MGNSVYAATRGVKKSIDPNNDSQKTLDSPVTGDGTVCIEAIARHKCNHKGPYNRLSQAYEALGRWIETNGYKITGPNRELYLYCTQPIRQDDDSYVTEIQFPVEKV